MRVLKQNIIFFTLFLVYLIFGAWYLLTHFHGEEVIYINTFHQPIADVFFKFYSEIGEGISFALVILGLILFVNYYQAIICFSVFVLSTLMVQIPKRLIFVDEIRPHKYFLGKVNFHLVDGVNVHHFNSFPSGHTGSAFALAMFATLYTKNKWYSILYFMAAVCMALSRIYLCQHFLKDVYFGAILGVISTLIVYYIYENYCILTPQSKLNKSLLSKGS